MKRGLNPKLLEQWFTMVAGVNKVKKSGRVRISQSQKSQEISIFFQTRSKEKVRKNEIYGKVRKKSVPNLTT